LTTVLFTQANVGELSWYSLRANDENINLLECYAVYYNISQQENIIFQKP